MSKSIYINFLFLTKGQGIKHFLLQKLPSVLDDEIVFMESSLREETVSYVMDRINLIVANIRSKEGSCSIICNRINNNIINSGNFIEIREEMICMPWLTCSVISAGWP